MFDVSIIIPTYNEEKYLPILLEALKYQEGATIKQEIIVVDDNSSDRTVEIAQKYNCIVTRNKSKKSDVCAMRNQGLNLAKGKTVLFMDADCACSKNFLAEMVTPILIGNVDVTLAMRHLPLEAKYKIYPQKYSRLMAFLFYFLPNFFWLKIPIRLLYWLRKWVEVIWEKKKIISPLWIPDRVHTAAIIAKINLAKKSGGWKNQFGSSDDTRYCWDIYQFKPLVKWRIKPILYYSYRRAFPLNFWQTICFVLKIKTKNQKKNYQTDKNGYVNPKGIR